MLRISVAQARDFDPTLPEDPAALSELLCTRGLEVTGAADVADFVQDVVVARVVSVAQHPELQRLHVCQVDDGRRLGGEADQPWLQVVSGAANIEVGRLYPLVRAGGRLPSGRRVKRAEIRGERSEGTLCTTRDLGMSLDAFSLVPLPDDAAAGAPIREVIAVEGAMLTIGNMESLDSVAFELNPKLAGWRRLRDRELGIIENLESMTRQEDAFIAELGSMLERAKELERGRRS